MRKAIILIIIILYLLSCTNPPNISSDPISAYKLKFTRTGKLERMKKGLYGMGYTTDGKYIYAVNGSSMGILIGTGILRRDDGPYEPKLRSNIIITKDIARYDPSIDKWSVNPIRLKPKTFCSAEYVDGEIYIFNGYDLIYYDNRLNRVANKNLEVFDIFTGNISHLGTNPFPVWYSGSAVWNNKIYVFGGSYNDGGFSNKLLVYDTYKDEWTRLANIPEGKTTRGEIVNGILYIFGGYNGIASQDILTYDISINEWKHIGFMPKTMSANAIAKNGDFIWLIGDYYNLSQVSVFNTKTHDFHFIKSNMYGRRHAGAEIIGNKLYVFGGNRESSGSFLSSIQVTDITEIENLLSQENSVGK